MAAAPHRRYGPTSSHVSRSRPGRAAGEYISTYIVLTMRHRLLAPNVRASAGHGLAEGQMALFRVWLMVRLRPPG
jgi:hypothetical protein